MSLHPPRRKVRAGALVRAVILAPVLAIALIAVTVPPAGAATTVTEGDSYEETFTSGCGASGTVKVWHPGGYDSGTGSVTVSGTFGNTHGRVTMTAVSSGQDCTDVEMRYFNVADSEDNAANTLADLGDDYYGGRVDKPLSEQTTTSNGDKVVGYAFTNDLGNEVNEDSEGGVVVREIIEDSYGDQRLGPSTCIGVVVYTTAQFVYTFEGSLKASSRMSKTGCLDEQLAAVVIAAHQARQADFAAKHPSLYNASAWSYTRE